MDQAKLGLTFAEISKTMAENELDGYEMLAVGEMIRSTAYIHVAQESDNAQDQTDQNWLDWLNNNNLGGNDSN